MNRRRALPASLTFLAIILVGTFIVLSSITYYLSINPNAFLSDLVTFDGNVAHTNISSHHTPERIPRIIHQTWKTEELPSRWKTVSQACRNMMPDYEFMLWTDDSSRDFIASYYPWFLENFDSYPYTIQRADAIRYFVLHHFGGIYMDLDIGCLRRLDPLLTYPVVLPKTIPVGVSNDLMFAEKGHPFFEQTIHNLVTFDHSWFLNYPTVMFSTGPMFLSAQYGIYSSSHPNTFLDEIRILPKSLYGKNAQPHEAPLSFFSHFYGSSWHSDDAAFISFLGTWGKLLMWFGLFVLILGFIKSSNMKQRRYTFRKIDILLPRRSHQSDRCHVHFRGWSNQSSPVELESSIGENISVLHLPYPPSPSSSTMSDTSFAEPYVSRSQNPIVRIFQRFLNRVATTAGMEGPQLYSRYRTQRRKRGVLFLPAIFTQTSDIELASVPPSRFPAALSRRSPLPEEKARFHEELEAATDFSDMSSSVTSSNRSSREFYFVSHSQRSSSRSRSRSSSRPLLS